MKDLLKRAFVHKRLIRLSASDIPRVLTRMCMYFLFQTKEDWKYVALLSVDLRRLLPVSDEGRLEVRGARHRPLLPVDLRRRLLLGYGRHHLPGTNALRPATTAAH